MQTQRAALLGVVISHGAPTRILTAFADSWVGAGGEDPVISQWVKSTRAELDQARKAACEQALCLYVYQIFLTIFYTFLILLSR